MRPAQRLRRVRRRANSKRAANWSARSTRRLSSPNVAGIDGAQQPPLEIAAAVERIDVLAGQRIPGDGVDGEVAPPRGLSRRQVRVARHREAAMSASGLRLAPRQRDVEPGHLVDGEALADGVDAAERAQRSLSARAASTPKTSTSMSLEGCPISRSRTQPPTISARPPASRTARAIAAGRRSGSDRVITHSAPCGSRSRCTGRTDRSCCGPRSG